MDLKSGALSLLTRHGEPFTYRQTTGATYNPATRTYSGGATATADIVGYAEPFEEFDGQIVRLGDQKLHVFPDPLEEASIVPAIGDFIAQGDGLYRVKHIEEWSVGETIALYTFHIRGIEPSAVVPVVPVEVVGVWRADPPVSGSATGGTNLEITPSGLQDGDILLAGFGCTANLTNLATRPSGWANLLMNTYRWVDIKTASVADNTTHVWTFTVTNYSRTGVLIAARGADPTPIAANSSNNQYLPDLTNTEEGALLVGFYLTKNDGTLFEEIIATVGSFDKLIEHVSQGIAAYLDPERSAVATRESMPLGAMGSSYSFTPANSSSRRSFAVILGPS